jgi:DNA-binding PadR family transcriptional regulator
MGILDLTRRLGVSRLTLLKWLHQMEEDGLLYRTYITRKKRGRPEILFRVSENSTRALSNANGTFILTGIGKHKGQEKYSIFENTIDFSKINESIINLDEKIFASSIVNNTWTLLCHNVKRDYENKLLLDKHALENLGAWVAIMAGLAIQQNKYLGECEFIAVKRKGVKGLMIPFEKVGLIVDLTIDKIAEPALITQKVEYYFNRLLNN